MQEYNLQYDDLQNGKYYTTEYPKQGKYTFRNGYKGFVRHNKYKKNSDGHFNPDNGFTEFREATEEEVKLLISG